MACIAPRQRALKRDSDKQTVTLNDARQAMHGHSCGTCSVQTISDRDNISFLLTLSLVFPSVARRLSSNRYDMAYFACQGYVIYTLRYTP